MQFNLLVPSNTPRANCLKISGQLWSLEHHVLEDSIEELQLKYFCISYTWGTGREPNPLNNFVSISDRTVSALKTFSRHRPLCPAIWIDAFCVPLDEPERTLALKSMGFVYAQAEGVMVILSSAAQPALTHMLVSAHIDLADLAILEQEEWVERAWTYQEAVNGKELFFACEGDDSIIVPQDRLFDCVGHALAHLSVSMIKKMRVYPRLNAFEDIMADAFTATYEGRSALSVMSNMDRRVQEHAADHFYAMIGAVTTKPPKIPADLHPCEVFMRVCEAEGDFSFIYSAAGRSCNPSRRWRPIEGELTSILPWHSWGERQPGKLTEQGLWLEKMFVAHAADIEEGATEGTRLWLKEFWKGEVKLETCLIEAIYITISAIGFKGSPACISTAKGFVFPLEKIAEERFEKAVVSTTVQWALGAPCLVLYSNGEKDQTLYMPAVYVGVVESNDAETVLVS